mmetsp:Transcript_65231/g.120075  ORF Transcript_65231/g.120075 Transcript_65231/m.120075 type:complete len:265 (-) Transcript_65231:43-837(-)
MKRSQLSKKCYKAAVEDLINCTEVRLTDLDAKFYQLLDLLQESERAAEACKFVRQALEGVTRERVQNWRAYIYTLLRKFDETVYNSMKSDGQKAPRPPRTPTAQAPALSGKIEDHALSATAPEFVPGQHWGGRLVGTTPTAQDHYQFTPSFWMPSFDQIMMTPPPKTWMSDKSLATETPEACVQVLQLDAVVDTPVKSKMPSPGSADHLAGTCRPCAFFHTKGCSNASECQFCHLCDPEEKKRRKKEKRLNASRANPSTTKGKA